MSAPTTSPDIWLEAILRDSEMRSAYRVAAALVEYLNPKVGLAWPSLPTLATHLSTHVATVRRAINKLVKAGYLNRTLGRGRGNSSTYQFTMRASK